MGVQLLLFHLGRELSFAKLKAVWSVALVGGALQIVAISALGGVVAAVLESPVTQVGGGVWYGFTYDVDDGRVLHDFHCSTVDCMPTAAAEDDASTQAQHQPPWLGMFA